MSAEKYLKPEVIRTVGRLDLRARFIVEGFLSGLHASPFQGFSVEFSEHRRYAQGDDPKDIDWLVFAKTDRFYVKKYQAETNISGWLIMDLSASMAYTHQQDLTKLGYATCLAAALAWLMIHQQDPVGLMTIDTKVRQSLGPKSKRAQLANILSILSQAKPQGETDLAQGLRQASAMIRHRSLLMIFTDLLCDAEALRASLRQLRFAKHDIILFHILDEAEVTFPFSGLVDFEEPETHETQRVDAGSLRRDYLESLAEFRESWRADCRRMGVDYVALDTSMPFDKALLEYLFQRRARF